MAKRAIDILVAAMAIVTLSPLFAAIAIAIAIGSGRPVFYRGTRTGRYGRPFKIFKFRTMMRDAERVGGTSTGENDPRITRVGAFLRRYKLDELPQLLNVLTGDMSLVGPRPEVAEYTDLYNDEELEILIVRPGMTDYASIRFRHLNRILATSSDPDAYYSEQIRPLKNRLRLEYVRRMCMREDLRILWHTLKAIVSFENEVDILPER